MSVAVGIRYPKGEIEGLHLANGTDADHDIDIDPGSCRDEADTYDIVNSGTLTPAIDTTGANGRDASDSLSNETWYAVYVIARTDTGAVAGFFSTSATWAGVGTQPTDYDVGRRLGWVRTDGSANIYAFLMQKDESRDRWLYYNYDTETTGINEIQNNGTASSFTDCALLNSGEDRIPSTACLSLTNTRILRTTSANTVQLELRPNAMSSTQRAFRNTIGLAATNDGRGCQNFMMPIIDGDRKIEYRINNNQVRDVVVVGYQDAL